MHSTINVVYSRLYRGWSVYTTSVYWFHTDRSSVLTEMAYAPITAADVSAFDRYIDT